MLEIIQILSVLCVVAFTFFPVAYEAHEIYREQHRKH
jgi:hypothetical protein